MVFSFSEWKPFANCFISVQTKAESIETRIRIFVELCWQCLFVNCLCESYFHYCTILIVLFTSRINWQHALQLFHDTPTLKMTTIVIIYTNNLRFIHFFLTFLNRILNKTRKNVEKTYNSFYSRINVNFYFFIFIFCFLVVPNHFRIISESYSNHNFFTQSNQIRTICLLLWWQLQI